MAVSDQPVTISYATDGLAVAFAFPYYFIGLDDLVVTFKDSTGIVTTKVRTTDYVVSGVLDSKLNTYSGGGTVTMNVVPAANGTLRIMRKTPQTQPAVYQPLDPFPAGTHEAVLDRAILVLQEIVKTMQIQGVADGPPTSGTYKVNDRFYNPNPTAGSSEGWICVAAGTPGTWKEFGTVSL